MIFIRQEVEILLNKEKDEYVIECHEIFEDSDSIHYVFDLVKGGELFDYVFSNRTKFRQDEQKAAFIIQQVLKGISALHSQNICHRDIKPENFLVEVKNNNLMIKLIDFGFATRTSQIERLRVIVGSISYMSPELYKGNYNRKCDIWAAGVVLYSMLVGFMPFKGKDMVDTAMKVKEQEVPYSHARWAKVSAEAKEVVQMMLNKDEKERPFADEILSHPCYSKKGGSTR